MVGFFSHLSLIFNKGKFDFISKEGTQYWKINKKHKYAENSRKSYNYRLGRIGK